MQVLATTKVCMYVTTCFVVHIGYAHVAISLSTRTYVHVLELTFNLIMYVPDNAHGLGCTPLNIPSWYPWLHRSTPEQHSLSGISYPETAVPTHDYHPLC